MMPLQQVICLPSMRGLVSCILGIHRFTCLPKAIFDRAGYLFFMHQPKYVFQSLSLEISFSISSSVMSSKKRYSAGVHSELGFIIPIIKRGDIRDIKVHFSFSRVLHARKREGVQ